MTEVIYPQEGDRDPIVVNLRDPYWAALAAWLWPGAGHFYQRRFAKGFLFMICILSIYFFGLALGQGRVVYASLEKGDFRWPYFCQIGVGLPALPAIPQRLMTKKGGPPMFVMCERYPTDTFIDENGRIVSKNFPGKKTDLSYSRVDPDVLAISTEDSLKDGFMAPPAGPKKDTNDVLGMWHSELRHNFELGTLFTVVAGLLNLLAIYDAFCGPAILTPDQKKKLEAKRRKLEA
ncbi:MAG: DUF6677 family protein [Planctomycetota bacterium]